MLLYRIMFAIFYVVIASAIITYVETGYFLVSIKALYLILSIDPAYLIIYMLGGAFFIQFNKNTSSTTVRYKELSEISQLWLKPFTEAEVLSANDDNPIFVSNDIEAKAEELHAFETEVVKLFVAEIVEKSKIDTEETRIIYSLLKLLEQNKTASSVASLYENDPETLKLKEQTSYAQLSKITLIEHTVRVARIAHDNITKIQEPLIGKILVTALAHDIGKINIQSNDILEDKKLLRINPHELVSAFMFNEMFKDYSGLKLVVDAIKTHHIGATNSVIAKTLKQADLKAREEEIALLKNNPIAIVDEKNNNTNDTMTKEETCPTPTCTIKKTEVDNVQYNDGIEANVLESSINILEHKDRFLPLLNAAINVAEKSNIGLKIKSVSYHEVILFDYMFFKKTLEISIKRRLDKTKFLEIMKELVDKKIVHFIDVQKGFYVSTFHIKSTFFEFDAQFIPVSCSFLGISQTDVELSKRNSPILRDVIVTTYQNSTKHEGE